MRSDVMSDEERKPHFSMVSVFDCTNVRIVQYPNKVDVLVGSITINLFGRYPYETAPAVSLETPTPTRTEHGIKTADSAQGTSTV
jgi:hypothetical protein